MSKTRSGSIHAWRASSQVGLSSVLAVNLDPRLLPAFVAVAEERHFGRAAQRLHVAQPALSQQVRRLEKQLGVRLFERDSRRVDLTPAGRALLPEAQKALAALARGQAAARTATGVVAPLRLGVDLDMPARVLERVHRFSRQPGGVPIRLAKQHQGDALTALRDGQLDVLLGWQRMPYGPTVCTLVVDTVELLAVVPQGHPEAGRSCMPRDVFAAHPIVMFDREPTPDVHDWIVTSATGRQPDQLDIRHVSSLDHGATAMLAAAAAGDGLTVAAAESIDGRHSTLTAVPFDPPLRHDVLLIWIPGQETDAVQAFIAHCAPGAWP